MTRIISGMSKAKYQLLRDAGELVTARLLQNSSAKSAVKFGATQIKNELWERKQTKKKERRSGKQST